LIFNYAYIDNTKKLFQAYICDLLSNIYSKLEWDPLPNENSETAVLRGLILREMGFNGHNKILDEAHKRFQKLLNDNNQYQNHSINSNIRAAIYLTVAKTGNQTTFEQLKLVIYFNKLINLINLFSILALSKSLYTTRTYFFINCTVSF